MILDKLFLLSGLFIGLSFLTVGGPTLGEMIATMAPIYPLANQQIAADLGLSFEEVAFPTGDGLTLRGWFFPTANPHDPAILYAPATAHDQLSGLSLVQPLHTAGYQVLLFSYRGHGQSDGSPFGFTYGAAESRDIDAAVRYLHKTRQIDHIGAIGHSAGAVAIILSAARNPLLDVVVAASPFNSVDEIWETNRPAFFPKSLFHLTFKLVEWRKGFSRNQVIAERVIGHITPRPLLLIHGSADRRITQEQAMRLFENAGYPKRLWLIEGASHQAVRSPGLDSLMDRLIPFLDDAFQS